MRVPFIPPFQAGDALFFWLTFFGLLFGTRGDLLSQESTGDLNDFQTPLTSADFDPQTFAEAVDGHEQAFETQNEDLNQQSQDLGHRPQWVIWTRDSQPGFSGIAFGDSKNAGPRFLRVGFGDSISVGTILTRGNVKASVLKPGAAYPGNLADDSQWIPALRIKDGEATSDETVEREDCACWIFPPDTRTRALRFTHTAQDSDASYAGWLGGAYVLSERLANLAPQALASASAHNEDAEKLNNESLDHIWGAWNNISMEESESRPRLIAESPEWVMLVWPHPVSLKGMGLIFPGFGAADAQIYTGPEKTHPRDAKESDWTTLQESKGISSQYPRAFGLTLVEFGKIVTTRALRLRLKSVCQESHPHLEGKTMNGKRVWLGEWMVLHSLGKETLEAMLPSRKSNVSDLPPPIPVPFTLPEDGFVTLVIEDSDGKRVRNLVSEMPFPKGKNVVGWDGSDDLGRDYDAARHGLYHIPARPVAPGNYRVRGLWHKAIEPHYEFSVYMDGNPAWNTSDHTGAWMANHTPPMAAAFVPGNRSPTGQPSLFLGAEVTEGPDGLVWVDLDGRKRGGKGWIGQLWRSAPYLAFDSGPDAVKDTTVYVGSSVGPQAKDPAVELCLTALTLNGEGAGSQKVVEKPVLKESLGPVAWSASQEKMLGGLAAYNGVLVCSLTQKNQLLFVSANSGKILGTAPIEVPRGLAFDVRGRLLLLSGKKLLRVDKIGNPVQLSQPETVVQTGLEEPVALALDADGNIYISDRGNSHQVKVFSAAGRFLRTIGKAGVPRAGPYDPLHMNHPAGLAVDSNHHLWVTEEDFLPKRVSVWGEDGRLVRAFYGPSKYGGGGALDSQDQSRFYLAEEENRGAMEFRLDWQKGTSQLLNVLCRREKGDPMPWAGAERSLYAQGRRYFTDCYNSNPTGGSPMACLFLEQNGIARPVAAMGRANEWGLLKEETFKSLWPAGVDPQGNIWEDHHKNQVFFIWTDANGDGRAQSDEVVLQKAVVGGVTVMPDLSFCVSQLDGKAMRFFPTAISKTGVPHYDLEQGKILSEDVSPPASSGGDQALASPDGFTVITLGVKPFDACSLCGVKDGKPLWSYPSLWPGLHASHEAPKPSAPGQVIGSTRLLGGPVSVKESEAGPIWAINGNMGNIYLFTSDGLFVSTVFQDVRVGKSWSMPAAQRGMSLAEITLHDENFWPTITQATDGAVYLVDGARTSLVRLDGLKSIRRLPDLSLRVTSEDLQKARDWLVESEAMRQQKEGRGSLKVAMRPAPPKLDGKLDDWSDAAWVDIDKSGVAANFNSNSKPYNIRGALAVANGSLYAAWSTADPGLLKNSGEQANALFKTGGALDLMIGANPDADPNRVAPVTGDLRLVVTQVEGGTKALLYRPMVPGSPADRKVSFSSPSRTVIFDQVEDISAQVQLAADKSGNYEIAVPLEVLGLKPKPGMKIRGDIGVLRGADGNQTVARVYWNNKATAIVSDVPSEAELTPSLWGEWEFSPK